MKSSNLRDIPWDQRRSPSGKFDSHCQDISLALGGVRNLGTWGGGHPFDVQIRRVPPGASVCPYHAHLAQWETFLVISGDGVVRTPEGETRVSKGNVFVHPPREPHQLTNIGTDDLVVYIVADNVVLDGFYYPDSEKWGLRPSSGYFRAASAHYFEGEDLVTSSDLLPAFSIGAADSTFRKLSADDLPWITWQSTKGTYQGASKALSIALGAKANTPIGLGGHPFDLELSRLEPEKCGCPFHSHTAQWELFIILSGRGIERTVDGTREVGPGDVTLYAPGDAHQLTNITHENLEFLLIADNPLSDVCHYPDSDTWRFRGSEKIFRAVDGDLWSHEE